MVDFGVRLLNGFADGVVGKLGANDNDNQWQPSHVLRCSRTSYPFSLR